MKKLFATLVVAVLSLTLWSCGGVDNTPSGVTKAFVERMQKQDVEGYVDLLYIEETDPVKAAKGREELTALFKEKIAESFDEKGGIKSCEVLSEEINESGDKAKVKMKTCFGNGEESTETYDLVKDAQGQWKIKIGK